MAWRVNGKCQFTLWRRVLPTCVKSGACAEPLLLFLVVAVAVAVAAAATVVAGV